MNATTTNIETRFCYCFCAKESTNDKRWDMDVDSALSCDLASYIGYNPNSFTVLHLNMAEIYSKGQIGVSVLRSGYIIAGRRLTEPADPVMEKITLLSSHLPNWNMVDLSEGKSGGLVDPETPVMVYKEMMFGGVLKRLFSKADAGSEAAALARQLQSYWK